ncbi:hypothetical protein ACJGE4_15515 [Bacillus velezensis]|uniref:hypothetical protein n=1 Tax=Bacillus velezensis TaxID=492670 RepID=UPI000C059D53|nr:hypothetical protein [Bacillus velezensis]ATO12220.1 hypothetical protein CRH11_20460 [Bacillus velezensis]
MAKLDGVKTLDMVNGEITKVAYGGAEYVKTDSPVQEGDLFLLTAGHEIISGESGEFYLTEKYRNGNIVIPTRFLGNATATQSDGDGIAFRKVAAAANPSVEERVAKAEGEIEALKSDVAALKGEPEYKRIDSTERFGYATPDQLEILTEEEAAKIERQQAEEAKWAKIGRKIGEYKKGDVVQFKDDYVAIGVVEDVGTSRLGVRMPDEAYQGPYKNDVTLITPVEARFDR